MNSINYGKYHFEGAMAKPTIKFHLGTVSKKKKKLMEFSIKLAGWVLNAPVFH